MKPHDLRGRAALIKPAPCPPSGGMPFIPMADAPGINPRKFLCLSDSVTGYQLHFLEGPGKPRTYPHSDNGTFCEGCRQHRAIRWKGFVCALALPTRKRVVLEITAGAYQYCPDLSGLKGQLRGKTIRLWRMHGESKNAPAKAEVLHEPCRLDTLPPAWDLHAALLRLWGFSVEVPREEGISPADLVDVPFGEG